MSRPPECVPTNGHTDIYQLLKEIMRKKRLEEISQKQERKPK